jgi:iron complex outermembrane receptor protein
MRNVHPITFQPVPWQKFTGDNNFMDEDATRNHYAAALQDEHHLTEHLTLMAGVRYDHYSDVEDDQITPRVSGVWQPLEHHIFKFQYARAFRPPTFLELTGNANFIQGSSNINSEEIDTFEVGYIFRANTIIAKITLFYSDLDDLITTEFDGSKFIYTNNASATQTGFELEYRQDIFDNLEFDGNLSYSTTNDDKTDKEVANARDWLVNLGLTYSPVEWAAINSQYRYVDQRHRTDTDIRNNLKSYDVLDITLSFYPTMISGLTLRTGLKNIFDNQAYVASAEHPFYAPTQSADYPVLDRFWWIQATYDF